MHIKGQGHSLTIVECHSDSTFSNLFFFLETAVPIEAKFYMEPPWDGETKVSSNGPGHMASMAAMPIYGKSLKIVFSGTKRPMTLKVDMQQLVLEQSRPESRGRPWGGSPTTLVHIFNII